MKKIAKLRNVGLLAALACVAVLHTPSACRAESKESIERRIAYHEALAEKYRLANKSLSIKYPGSWGDPEFHRRKAEALRKQLR